MKVVVIGGGASGMFASAIIANRGNDIVLIEKNEKLGKKLYITGKGRCNVTNDCAPREFLDNVVTNPKFLTSAVYNFPPEKMMAYLEDNGLSLTVERGNRVFPTSNKSSDVIKTLQRACERNGVEIHLNTTVQSVCKEDLFKITTDNGVFFADKVIIATGGVSYPMTGSTGDGYKFAKCFGHNIIPPKPSLCPIIVKEKNVAKSLEGLSLKNVQASIMRGSECIFRDFGEMLFTSDGVSGPIILSASANINKIDFAHENIKLSIDLKPALSDEELDKRVLSDFQKSNNKEFKNALFELLPRKIIPVIIERSKINPDTKVNQISAESRKNLVKILKNFDFNVSSLANVDVAVVTSGGVNIKEINPKTMESKNVTGLYFIGEVLDVDAYTGGFNLQIAFATAYQSAMSI